MLLGATAIFVPNLPNANYKSSNETMKNSRNYLIYDFEMIFTHVKKMRLSGIKQTERVNLEKIDDLSTQVH